MSNVSLIDGHIDLVKNDLVEVVRCLNCAYANSDGTICRYGTGTSVKPNHYCSYGERKESEVTE